MSKHCLTSHYRAMEMKYTKPVIENFVRVKAEKVHMGVGSD